MTALQIVALLSTAAALAGQGTRPKAQPSEYPVHTALDKGCELGAEYMVHSIPTPSGILIADDYLIVDVAFFGPLKTKLDLSSGNFVLRINNQKSAIQPNSAASVAASLKYPSFAQPSSGPAVTGGVGIGLGMPIPVSRPLPNPAPADPNGPAREVETPLEERIEHAALVEGDQPTPASGLIFFPYRGRMKSIKSIELIYEGPAGKVSLKLL